MKSVFLVDFDGTITREDFCVSMMAAYCRPGYMAIEKRWRSGEISTLDCAREIFGLMDVTENELLKLAYSMEVDATFHEFIEYCTKRQEIVWIISDGYDFYIDPILKYHGWGEIPYYSNHLYFKDDRLQAAFPHAQPACEHCGNCKGLWVDHFKERGYTVYLIGDGSSDICGTENADHIFAKKALLRYCREKGIACSEYSDFKDIVTQLKGLDG